MYKAILFDFDGTLANTMEAHFEAWYSAFFEFGGSVAPEDYYPLEGMPLPEIAKTLALKNGVDAARIPDIVKKKEDAYLSRLDGGAPEFYPGVLKRIDDLVARGIPIGIVTGGFSDRIYASVPKDFLDKFSVIITSDRVSRGKPYPDPYLAAAAKLGVDSSVCIGVENAPLGVESVKSAGMYCIGVASTVAPEVLRGADEVALAFTDISKTKAFADWL